MIFKVNLDIDIEFKWDRGNIERTRVGLTGFPIQAVEMEVHDKPKIIQDSLGNIELELAYWGGWSIISTWTSGTEHCGKLLDTREGRIDNIKPVILNSTNGNLVVDINGTIVVGPVTPCVNTYGIVHIQRVPFLAKDLFNVEI